MSAPAVEKTHPFDEAVANGRLPYKVSDLSLAEHGRDEIRLAEQEMPGIIALRKKASVNIILYLNLIHKCHCLR